MSGNGHPGVETTQPSWSGSVFPVSLDAHGSPFFDPRAGLFGMLTRAMTLPGDVYAGRVDPMSNEGIGRATDLGGLLGLGNLGNFSKSVVSQGVKGRGQFASRSANLYNPPVKNPRAFTEDYKPQDWPDGPPTDATGRLTHDIEGRPLQAEHIVGRRMVGGLDEALPSAQLESVAQGSAGASITDVAPRTLGGDAGRLVKTTDRRSGNSEYEILLSRALPESQRPRVAAHEVGHLIHDLASRIPVAGMKEELRRNYHVLNDVTWRRLQDNVRPGLRTSPEGRGYAKGGPSDRELMAEAIRAYMTDPNYFKSVAPETAAAIRAAVNENPNLSKAIQFNVSGVPLPMTEDQFREYQRQGGA